ncbi:MnhB domain-containing protein [Pontiellaceae bacterium B12227]|nr:MnhB domain-containing protein [Pontiellaceae bacterium B12227]
MKKFPVMRWIYVILFSLIFIRLALLPKTGGAMEEGIAERIAIEAHIPNSVSGILLRNRLYDTVFEVFVFTLAVLGVQYAFSLHRTEKHVQYMRDETMVILARIAAMVSGLVFLELAVRGHLAPGGGFAAGVAGGSAIGLVALTMNIHELYDVYQRKHIASVEKTIVLLIVCAAVAFMLFPGSSLAGQPTSSFAIPLLNVLIAAKVAIGSWTIVLLFIRHRGLL